MTLVHHHSARNPRGIAILLSLWIVVLLLWLALDASPLIVILLLLVLLPAAWDIARDRRATFRLDAHVVEWQSGGQSARIARADIDRMRVDTRLDLSLRITIWTLDGIRFRLPPDAVPPARDLFPALDALDYPYTRRHFAFL